MTQERATISLSLADLGVLADTAERNGTLHAFPAVALQWAANAQTEITRLRTENADLRATLKQAREALVYGVRKMNHLGEALGCMPLHAAIAAIDKVQP